MNWSINQVPDFTKRCAGWGQGYILFILNPPPPSSTPPLRSIFRQRTCDFSRRFIPFWYSFNFFNSPFFHFPLYLKFLSQQPLFHKHIILNNICLSWRVKRFKYGLFFFIARPCFAVQKNVFDMRKKLSFQRQRPKFRPVTPHCQIWTGMVSINSTELRILFLRYDCTE